MDDSLSLEARLNVDCDHRAKEAIRKVMTHLSSHPVTLSLTLEAAVVIIDGASRQRILLKICVIRSAKRERQFYYDNIMHPDIFDSIAWESLKDLLERLQDVLIVVRQTVVPPSKLFQSSYPNNPARSRQNPPPSELPLVFRSPSAYNSKRNWASFDVTRRTQLEICYAQYLTTFALLWEEEIESHTVAKISTLPTVE